MSQVNRYVTLKHVLLGLTAGLSMLSMPMTVLADSASIGFGSSDGISEAQIEITSESLTVSETEGTVLFSGDVVISQGEIELSAAKVMVTYNNETAAIITINASNGVRLISSSDAVEADGAQYDVQARTVLMSGNVVLTQGAFALSAKQMSIDLNNGTAQMIGRVKTILQPKKKL
jgi:lipopolysaccharide export system protein LptA